MDNNTNIITIKAGHCNCYLIKGSSGYLLIDTGVPGQMKKFQQALDKHNLEWNQITAIVLTHTHYDHVGNLCKIRQLTKAKLLCHRDAVIHLKNGFTPFPKGTTAYAKIIAYLASTLLRKANKFNPDTADIVVDDIYDLESIGLKGVIIHTPGHTSDSLTVIYNDKAFVGDTMFHFTKSKIYPPFANNIYRLKESWHRIRGFNCETYYPAHGHPISEEIFQNNLNKLV